MTWQCRLGDQAFVLTSLGKDAWDLHFEERKFEAVTYVNEPGKCPTCCSRSLSRSAFVNHREGDHPVSLSTENTGDPLEAAWIPRTRTTATSTHGTACHGRRAGGNQETPFLKFQILYLHFPLRPFLFLFFVLFLFLLFVSFLFLVCSNVINNLITKQNNESVLMDPYQEKGCFSRQEGSVRAGQAPSLLRSGPQRLTPPGDVARLLLALGLWGDSPVRSEGGEVGRVGAQLLQQPGVPGMRGELEPSCTLSHGRKCWACPHPLPKSELRTPLFPV